MNTLSKEEMQKIQGGISTEELIAQAWERTPDGGSSTWTNRNDGCFDGQITCACGFRVRDVICR